MTGTEPAVLALGSNLGDRPAFLRAAVADLAQLVRVRAVSPVYETDPVGGPAQGRYLNAVVLADAPAGVDLLGLLGTAESRAGRTREVRFGPRTLDVDLITVGDRRSEDPDLLLPHPRAHLRAFVLAPWLDVDPDAQLPGHGRVADLLAGLDRSGVHRRDDLDLRPAGRAR